MKGIVTALHGVVGCGRITVKSEKGLILFSPLKIDKVDIEHDIALLISEELERKDAEGLEVAQNVKWNSLGAVRVEGHPFGINNLGTSLVVRTPPLRILKELIPPHISSLMRNRNSPNPLINVLSIQGDILPGHSGAPILDSQNRVIAVGNGGLEGGTVGISWAIPFKDIELEPAESNKRLVALAQADIRVLFSIDANTRQDTSAVSADNDGFCEIVGKYLDASRDGFMSIVSKPSTVAGLFDSTIQLPGLYNSAVSPRNYAYSVARNSTNSSQIEAEYFHLIRKMSSCLAGWSTREYIDEFDGKENMIFIFWQSTNGPVVSIERDITGFVYEGRPPIYDVKAYFYAPGYKNPNPRDTFCEIVGKYLDASRDGFMSIVSKPSTIDNLFDSTIQLPGLYNSAVSPRNYAYSVARNSTNSSQIEAEYFHLIRKMSSCLAGWSTREYVDKTKGREDMIFMFWQSTNGPVVSIERDITGFVYKDHPPIYNIKVYFYAPGYKTPAAIKR